MCVDFKEQQRLAQFKRTFYNEVKQSVINVITENTDYNDVEIRKKIGVIIEKYFNKQIGVEKMGAMLSYRGCISDPEKILEEIKTEYLKYYETCPLPRVNSLTTLTKIAAIEKEVEEKIDETLKDKTRMLGFCHFYWAAKKKILCEDYGIIWYTPAECNPDVMYD